MYSENNIVFYGIINETRRPNAKRGAESTDMGSTPKSIKIGHNKIKVPSANTFSSLNPEKDLNAANDEDEIITRKTTSKITIPPITVANTSLNDLQPKINSISLSKKVNYKIISIGCKIFCQTTEDYDKVINYLKNNNIKFFCYAKTEDKPFKVILKGLPDFEIDELRNILSVEKIHMPTSIKKLKQTTGGKPISSQIYLFYFKRDVKFGELRKIRSIYNIIISWERQLPRRYGPTQCRNCQMYGHGTSHCYMDTKCMMCGAAHKIIDCPVTKLELPVRETSYKCANCGGPHSANHPMCSKKIQYNEIISKTRQNKTSVNRHAMRPPLFDNDQFPQLPPSKIKLNTVFGNSCSVNNNSSTSWQKPRTMPNTNNLFSPNMIIEIVGELLPRIMQCKSNTEQMQLIFEFSFRYCNEQTK